MKQAFKHTGLIGVAAILACSLTFSPAFRTAALAGTKAAQDLSPSVRRLLTTVKEAMDKEDYKTAVERILAAAKPGDPPCGHPLVCLALGNCHLIRHDLTRAEEAYLTALELDKSYLDAQVNLAKVYTDANRHADAAKAFLSAYGLSDPKFPDYLYYAAVMTLMDGKAKQAAQVFERLFAAHPAKVTRAWKENYANALMTAKCWNKAIPVVRDLAENAIEKERIKWQETLLQIYLTVDDKPAALAYATTLSREAPTVARWWKALVHIRLSLGQYDRALTDLVIYGFLTPLSREEKKLLADLSLQLQIPSRAARMYESLLDGGPQDARHRKESVERLVSAYRQMGRTDKALALLGRFDPKICDPELILLKGDVLYEAKRFKDADEAFRTAARKNCSQQGQAWLMAGYAAWQYNDLTASRSAFERAAKFKRHRKDALAAMAQLTRTSQM